MRHWDGTRDLTRDEENQVRKFQGKPPLTESQLLQKARGGTASASKPKPEAVKKSAPRRVVRTVKSFRERELEVQAETVKALERVEHARAFAKRYAEPPVIHIHQAPQSVTLNDAPLELVDEVQEPIRIELVDD